MSTTIGQHTLTLAQTETLNMIQDHLRKVSGSQMGHANVYAIFGGRNNVDNARRRTARKLTELGVLRACGIYLSW
jgi:hypothetical protein